MAEPLNLSDAAPRKISWNRRAKISRVCTTMPRPRRRIVASIDELLGAQAWTELDDRFYRDIAFGTGGMRGRTIGKVQTKAELGSATPGDCPAIPRGRD